MPNFATIFKGHDFCSFFLFMAEWKLVLRYANIKINYSLFSEKKLDRSDSECPYQNRFAKNGHKCFQKFKGKNEILLGNCYPGYTELKMNAKMVL